MERKVYFGAHEVTTFWQLWLPINKNIGEKNADSYGCRKINLTGVTQHDNCGIRNFNSGSWVYGNDCYANSAANIDVNAG